MYKFTQDSRDSLARTLEPYQVSGSEDTCSGYHSHTHPSGWTISGEVREDYFLWVNDFKAEHPIYGWVRGNFETEVRAKSKRGFDHFLEHHPYKVWDYDDI